MKTVPAIHVICHDHSIAISGRIRRADDYGCELVSGVRTAGPVFARKTRVLLNLLDERSGHSMNVLARLTGVIRDGGAWVYRVRWPALPALLLPLATRSEPVETADDSDTAVAAEADTVPSDSEAA